MPIDRREPERSVNSELASVNRRLDAGGERMTAIESELKTNSETTKEIRDLLEAVQFGMRVIGWLGFAVEWLAKILVAAGSIYAALEFWKHGTPPK